VSAGAFSAQNAKPFASITLCTVRSPDLGVLGIAGGHAHAPDRLNRLQQIPGLPAYIERRHEAGPGSGPGPDGESG
jgi:hypothetical protein